MFYPLFKILSSGNVICLSNITVICHSNIVYAEINSSTLIRVIPSAYSSFKIDTIHCKFWKQNMEQMHEF